MEDGLGHRINGEKADQKRIETENGITSGFKKALKQECTIVVIDMTINFKPKHIDYKEFVTKLDGRRADFLEGRITECYVTYKDRAIVFTADMFKEADKAKRRTRLTEHIKTIGT